MGIFIPGVVHSIPNKVCTHEVLKFTIFNGKARYSCNRCAHILSSLEVQKRKIKTQISCDPALFFTLAPAQRKVLMATGEGRAVWRNYQTKVLNHLTGAPSSVVHQRCTDALVDKGLTKLNGHVWELTDIGRFLWERNR